MNIVDSPVIWKIKPVIPAGPSPAIPQMICPHQQDVADEICSQLATRCRADFYTWKHFHSLQQWQSVCASFCMDFRIQIVIYIGYHPMLLIFDRTSHNIIADCHV